MKEMDDMLKSFFENKPIAPEPLQKMNTSIMDRILDSPVDFQERIIAKQRKRWGVFFIGLLLLLSLSIFLLNWFFGAWFNEGISSIVLWLNPHIPFLAWFEDRWNGLFDILAIFSNLKIGYQLLWGQYGLAVMGILVSWVLFEGIRDKENLHQKES